MENKKISILLSKEAGELFSDIGPEFAADVELNTAGSYDIIKQIYLHNPDFVVFDISNLTDDSYLSLAKLKKDSAGLNYRLLFIRDKEEAKDVAAALQQGVNQYFMKLLGLAERNAHILNFMELRESREELQTAYAALNKAAHEMNKKNRQLQIAIDNMEKLTVSDYLTGVYNRRYILERIRQEVVRYKRNKRKFCFVMCDIDHYKRINDNYGHAFGDQIVADVAKGLCETCREMDVLSRWGGDEFLFLLPETDMAGAVIFAERTRKVFEENLFDYDHIAVKITLTFGIAEYDDTEGINESIKKADEALLKGKTMGRNIVMTNREL